MTQTAAEPVPAEKPEPPQTTDQTGFNSFVGINEAARLTRRSKGHISQDTKSGRLSYVLNDRQQKQYQVSELARVYGLKTGEDEGSENRDEPQEEPTATTVEIAVLKAQLAIKDEIINDLRADKDKLWHQLQHRLPAPQPAASVPPSEGPLTASNVQPHPASQSLWRRIFGA